MSFSKKMILKLQKQLKILMTTAKFCAIISTIIIFTGGSYAF